MIQIGVIEVKKLITPRMICTTIFYFKTNVASAYLRIVLKIMLKIT